MTGKTEATEKSKLTPEQKKMSTKLARELHRIDYSPNKDESAQEEGANTKELRRKDFTNQRKLYGQKARRLIRRLESTGVTLHLDPKAKDAEDNA